MGNHSHFHVIREKKKRRDVPVHVNGSKGNNTTPPPSLHTFLHLDREEHWYIDSIKGRPDKQYDFVSSWIGKREAPSRSRQQ